MGIEGSHDVYVTYLGLHIVSKVSDHIVIIKLISV